MHDVKAVVEFMAKNCKNANWDCVTRAIKILEDESDFVPEMLATGYFIPKKHITKLSIDLLNKINNMAMFSVGDWVYLKNLQGVYHKYNGCKAYISEVIPMAAFYYSYNLYTAIVPDGNNLKIEQLQEGNFTEYRETMISEPEVWPPVCTCDKLKVCNYGCDCGAMIKERQMMKEGKNIGQSSVGVGDVII